jgi:hypothetical protein
MTNYTATTATIDLVGIKLSASKGLGKSVQALKDQATSTYQWIVADHVYNAEALTNLLSHWLEKSELVGEPRRTAKEALVNAVSQWGEGNVHIEINERDTGKKTRGIHISYPDLLEQKNKAYAASVKALAKAFKDHGHTIYDALALLEMERQEGGKAATTTNTTDNVKALLDIKAQNVADKVAEKRAELLQSII